MTECRARHHRMSGEWIDCVSHDDIFHVGVASFGRYTWPLNGSLKTRADAATANLHLIMGARLTELSLTHALALGALRTGHPAEALAALERIERPIAVLVPDEMETR